MMVRGLLCFEGSVFLFDRIILLVFVDIIGFFKFFVLSFFFIRFFCRWWFFVCLYIIGRIYIFIGCLIRI